MTEEGTNNDTDTAQLAELARRLQEEQQYHTSNDDDDELARVVYIGPLCDFEGLRHDETKDVSLKQRIGDDGGDFTTMKCVATFVFSASTSDIFGDSIEEDGVEAEDEEENEAAVNSSDDNNGGDNQGGLSFDKIAGTVYITTNQVWFVAESDAKYDLSVGGSCILLHAITTGDGGQDHAEEMEDANDEETMGPSSNDQQQQDGVYLQISNPNNSSVMDVCDSNGNTTSVCELTLIPTRAPTNSQTSNDSTEDQSLLSQTLFRSLCKLVSSHPPIDDDDGDDDDENDDTLMFNAETSMGMGVGMDGMIGLEEDGATDAERNAMLDHLDSILIVRPDLEIKQDADVSGATSGQFDDAAE